MSSGVLYREHTAKAVEDLVQRHLPPALAKSRCSSFETGRVTILGAYGVRETYPLFPLLATLKAGKTPHQSIPEMRLHRPNSTAYLQVGDLIKGGRVDHIQKGHSHSSAKNGDDIFVVPWRDLPRDGDKIIVSIDSPAGAYWRRGTMVQPSQARLDVRTETKMDLRRTYQQGRRALVQMRILYEAGKENGEELILVGRILSDIRHSLAECSRPSANPERTFLRQRMRDIDQELAWDRRVGWNPSPLDMRKVLHAERDGILDRLKEIGRERLQTTAPTL